MKLTFLGTSHGVPMKTRFCSSALLEVGGAWYLIDGGAPVADLLIRRDIPFESLRAVFTTHAHSDHTVGLLGLLSLSNWYYKKSSYDCYLTEKALMDSFRGVLLATDKAFDEERLRMKLVTADCFYQDENITVTAVPTRHMGEQYPSYAYIIDTAERKRVIFTGDMHGGDAQDFPKQAKEAPSAAIICEMAHFDHTVILPILRECPTEQYFINHIYCRYEENLAAIRAAAEAGMPIRAVEDGDEYEL